ncbi:hypothetical protein HMA55_05190 [Corynebacterium sp. zg-913]|uniref:VIT family protein n=1 Tax=Corynebacterium wankanglinii TaxID=2735136 RepID=A0A7V9A1Q4_9CORY|nr:MULTISPECIES: VIT1/CCC1 transporter family protein [Corynebacterium]MBA1837303.1 hypothetical protein [Corynebacterium wankanglinii]
MTDVMSRPNAECPDDCPGLADAGVDRQDPGTGERLNRLRAAVLGANDGIVSTAAVVVGVAGATSDQTTIAMSGLAAVIGGAVSMALGEYVSVSSQRDSERAMGLPAHAQVNPWSAGIASFFSFLLGAALPFATALLAPAAWRIAAIFGITLVALALTGALSAKLGGAPVGRSVARIVVGGSLALAATFAIGSLFGANVG